MRRRSFMALSGASLVCGCSGAVHQLPQISRNNLGVARTEVQGAGGPPVRRFVTDEEVVEALRSALQRGNRPGPYFFLKDFTYSGAVKIQSSASYHWSGVRPP